MKRFLTALLLAFMVSCPSFAVVLEQMQTNTIPEKISSSTPLWTQLAGSSTVSLDASSTFDLTMPSVYLATTSSVVLATNAVTLLQSVASFTSGDLVIFQGRSKFYWALTSGTSETAAGLQSTGFVAEGNDSPIQANLNTSANLAFVADPTSIATLTYTLIRLQ